MSDVTVTAALLFVTSMLFFGAGYESFSTLNNEKDLDSPSIVVCRFPSRIRLLSVFVLLPQHVHFYLRPPQSGACSTNISHALLHLGPVYPQFQHTLPSPFPLSLWPFPPLLPLFLNLHSLPPRLTSVPPLPTLYTSSFPQVSIPSLHTGFHCGGCGSVISCLLPFVEVYRRGNSEKNRVASWPYLSGRSRLHQR